MPETLDISNKQAFQLQKTLCKLNIMIYLLQGGIISTFITLYDIGTSAKSKS